MLTLFRMNLTDTYMETSNPNGKEIFATGAQRDSQTNKFDWIEYMSEFAMFRYAQHMWNNAKKYGPGNWKKGIPQWSAKRSMNSHLRKLNLLDEENSVWCEKCHTISPIVHKETYLKGEMLCIGCGEIVPWEDHAAALMFNVMIYMHNEAKSNETNKGA